VSCILLLNTLDKADNQLESVREGAFEIMLIMCN
jgi:hypothetical protein